MRTAHSSDAVRKEMLIARAAIQRIEMVHAVGALRGTMASVSGWRHWLGFATNSLSAMFLPPQARMGNATGNTAPTGTLEILLGFFEVLLPRGRPVLRAVIRGIRLWQLGSRLFEQVTGKRPRRRAAASTTPPSSPPPPAGYAAPASTEAPPMS